jgi:16S rRNA (adenine1518-N6/adenine1519-N6)-dimethyltransferase
MRTRNRVNVGGAALAPRRNARRSRPKLGQNFLADRSYAERIVAALGDISRKTVLEIGAGRGVLTGLLAARAGRVIAVELDRVLAAQLRMKYATRTNLELIEGDILKIDPEALLRQRPGGPAGLASTAPEPVRVAGNLPYYLTSDILLHLFAHHACLESAVLMVQREVADRIAARPGSRDYGLLSATTQLYAQVEKLFTVPPGAFNPPPKVFSAVLRLTVAPRFGSLRVPEKGFIEFLKLCFAQKRKTLFNNLRARYEPEDVRAALRLAGVRPDVRAEALTLQKTASVFRRLTI